MTKKRQYNKVKNGKKTCPNCQKEKTVSSFYRKENGTVASWCKLCTKRGSKKPRPLKSEQSRKSHLKRYYGITPEQYNDLLKKQNHRCAVCEKHESESKTRLAVDHNHVTGEIRGLLCNYCNHRLVGRHRDGDLLRKIADYVDQGTGLFVPKKRPVKKRRKK